MRLRKDREKLYNNHILYNLVTRLYFYLDVKAEGWKAHSETVENQIIKAVYDGKIEALNEIRSDLEWILREDEKEILTHLANVKVQSANDFSAVEQWLEKIETITQCHISNKRGGKDET